jgi:CRISPR/Cas system-associated endoribonuclease Cas2
MRGVKMAYRIQDMMCELSRAELEEIKAFVDRLIEEKADEEQTD